MNKVKEKTRENFSRRRANRLGLILQKSRARLWSIDNQQGYRLVNFNSVILYGERFEHDIKAIEQILDEYEIEVKKAG